MFKINMSETTSIQTDYSKIIESYSTMQRVIMTFLAISVNFVGLLPIKTVMKNPQWRYELIVMISASICSFMYHLTEILNRDIYFSSEDWHELDNTFIVAGISIFLFHITGNHHSRFFIYSTLCVSVVSQKKYYKDLRITIGTIVFYLIIIIITRIVNRDIIEVKYYHKYLMRTLICWSLAIVFFVRGLKKEEDYLRYNHSLWHTFGIFGLYYMIISCESRIITDTQTIIPYSPIQIMI